MLKFISRKIAFQWIIFLGLFMFAIYTVITKSQLASAEGTPFLFQSFVRFFSQYEYFGKGIIIAVLLFQILFLEYYFKINEFVAKNSLLPACFYLSILLLSKSLTIISPFFFTLFFSLIIISIDFTGNVENLKNNVFRSGAIIALATGFDICSIVLLFSVIATLLINQFSRIKEIGILIFGFVLLYLYIFSFYFFTDNLYEWLMTFQQIKIAGILSSNIPNMTRTLLTAIGLSIVYISFLIRFKLLNDSKIVIQRNRVITLNTRAILMLVCLLLSSSNYPVVLGYLFVHLSIYLAMLAQERNPLYINELITIITLVALWL
ncbi:MAG: hypothetical protein FWF70_05505 [Bacteroidetes bacterium]|nr:hypothetical protein [Bacteroidota bacterium]MCL1968496.1 hypothetical protein [Bacteroidota bacterium]